MLNLDEVEESVILPEQIAGVTFTDQHVGAETETAQEEVTANAQPVPQPAAPQPEVDTQPAPEPVATPTPIRQTIGMDDLAHRTTARINNIEERTKRLRKPNGLSELESEPAYKRRNIQLRPTPNSDESQATGSASTRKPAG